MNLWQNEHYGVVADIVCWCIFGLTAAIVALRFFCRVRTGTKLLGALGLDDLVTLICLLIILSACILMSVASSWGLGQHFQSLDPEHQVQAMKYNAIIDAVIIWGFSTPKFAIVFLLKRILNHGFKTSILFWTLAIVGQALILATSIWVFKQCDPVSWQWDQYAEDPSLKGVCAPVSTLTDIGYLGSSYSAFLDVFFAIYPVPFVMKLRMPLKNRIIISFCLSLGAIACIISIYKLSIMGMAFAIMASDPTFPIPYLNTLGISEACILISCGSLPALGPLFRAASTKLNRSHRSNTGYSQPTYITNDSRDSNARNGWARLQDRKPRVADNTASPANVYSEPIPLDYMH